MRYFMATEVAYPKAGVTKLKQDLGYGRPGQKRDNRFSEALRKYIKRYKSRCKIAGKDLCKWEGHKSQLTDMVLDFLEERENGPRWWPDDKTSFNYGPLQFSEHGEKIGYLMKQLFFKIIVQGRRNKPKVATDRASQRQDPRQPNGVEPINVDDLPELSRQRTYPSPRPSQSPRLNQPLRTDQPLRSDQLSRPDQQSESQVPRSGAEQALTLQPTVYEEVDPFADYENRTSIINGPERRFHDTGYEGMSPDNIYDATPSPSTSLAGSIEGLGKRKQDPFPRQDLDYVRAKRARYQHATTFNAGPSSTGNIGSSSSGVAERLDLSGLRNESEMASSDHEHQSVVYPEYPTFLREFDGFDAVDSIESDVFQETASRVPEAPVARMDRQDTVGTIGRDIEPTPAANSMPNTSHGSEPQFAVPPLPSRIPARFPQSSRNIRATSEFPSSERRHQSSFYLHKKDQDSIRNLPYDAEKSTPIRRPCSTERSETSTSRRPCSTEGSETSTSTPTSNTPATEVRSRHSTPSRQMKFSVYVTPHCCKLWRLEGDFRKKTLKELVDEMREKFQLGSNFTELSLVLTISEQTFEDQVELGNERGFEDIKLRFSGKMNSHRRSVRASEGMADPVLEISFEPLWNDMAVIEEDDRGWVSSAA